MDANASTPPTHGRRTPRPFLPAILVLVLALAVSCGGASSGGGGDQQPAGGGEAPAQDQALGREPLGEANAPVVLTEYGDYQ